MFPGLGIALVLFTAMNFGDLIRTIQPLHDPAQLADHGHNAHH